MLTKHQGTIPQEVLEYLTKTGIPPQGGRGDEGGGGGGGG